MKHDHSAFGVENGVGLTLPVDPRTLVSIETLLAASENAYPVVARRTISKDRLGPTAGAACALLLGGLTFWSLATHRVAPVQHKALPPASTVAEDVPVRPAMAPAPLASSGYALPKVAPTPAPEIDILPTTPSTFREAVPPPVGLPTPAETSASLDTPSSPAETSAAHRAWAPMLVVDGGSPVEEGAGDTKKDASAASDTASATRMNDPSRTIAQGSLIPAVLETAIDSDLPGYARAVVTRDVTSFDRTQVLIPRSSRLIGEYKSGLADGQKRVYVTWTRLIRPDGVSIAIASPATAPSGGTGLPGRVNSHFIQRFGSAILLTVVGAASAVGSSGLILAGSQSAASVAATHDAAIPPTIRIRPGQPVRVFTAHDLDFSTISAAQAR